MRDIAVNVAIASLNLCLRLSAVLGRRSQGRRTARGGDCAGQDPLTGEWLLA